VQILKNPAYFLEPKIRPWLLEKKDKIWYRYYFMLIFGTKTNPFL
jgi:hypothetical protein